MSFILQSLQRFTYVTAHSPNLPPLYLRHSSFDNPSVASPTLQALHLHHSSFSNPSAASPMSQVILQLFRCFTYVTGTSRTSPAESARHRGMKKQCVVDKCVTKITKFRSRYSFGQLLRILLRAVNLFSFIHIVSSDSSFNIHNALYFVKYPSRAAQNSPEGRGLKNPALHVYRVEVK